MFNEARYIDIHGHMNFPEYEADREDVIARAQNAGVAMITVGTGIESSSRAVELARMHENMWATVGIHPTDTKESLQFPLLSRLAHEPQVVAIGECGLDYFHSTLEHRAIQMEVFEQHIALANEVSKPMMLHVRNGKNVGDKAVDGGNAYQDALGLVRAHAKVRVNFHFFAGSIADLKDILDIGGMVSFTGVVTFTRDYDELIRYVPLERIMSETDCPFVAPVPYRGKRSEPVHVVEVVSAIAKIRGDDPEKVRGQLLINARNFFNLN